MKRITYNPDIFRILVVDDDPVILKFHEIILKQAGFLFKTVCNGQLALEEIKKENYDLVLLDVMMPGLDGFQVCQQLKENPDTENIPVIFVTAKADIESVSRGFEVGGQDYVTKPINKQVLLARIKNHLALKLHTDQLSSINKKLDQKVRERTKELIETNESIHKKNKELQSTIQELTKAKISRKATTYAFVFTLIIFLLSEAIIDPYIDRSTASIYYSLLVKGLIALLFKPMEMLIELVLVRHAVTNQKKANRFRLGYGHA